MSPSLAFLMTQMVKNLPTPQETQVQTQFGQIQGRLLPTIQEILCWEDALEKEMATHSSILAWRIPWRATVHRVTKSRTQLSD